MIGLLLATVYFLWLGTLIFRSFAHIDAMNPEYIFVMVITLVTIVGAMSAVYTGALAPDQVGMRVFPGLENARFDAYFTFVQVRGGKSL